MVCPEYPDCKTELKGFIHILKASTEVFDLSQENNIRLVRKASDMQKERDPQIGEKEKGKKASHRKQKLYTLAIT